MAIKEIPILGYLKQLIISFIFAPWYAVLYFSHQYQLYTHQTAPLSKNKI